MRRKGSNEMKKRENCKGEEKGDIDYRTGIRETSNGERDAGGARREREKEELRV